MADNAHIVTDNKLAEMEKHLSAIYSKAQKEVGESWTKYLEDIGKEIESLQSDYDAIQGNTEEKREAGIRLAQAKKNKILKDKHYKQLSEQLAEQLANVNKTALAYINDQLPGVYSINYNSFEDVAEKIEGYSFELVDANVVKNLASKDESLLPYKELDESKDIRWSTKKINSEVLQGILQGESMDKIAKRLENVIKMDSNSAIRNARTMVTGAECKGRQDSYEQAVKDGVQMQREWVATNDSRTRHWHSDLDGVLKDVDEPFENDFGEIMYPGDPHADGANIYNCRCTLAAKIIGYIKKEIVKEFERSELLEKPKRPKYSDFNSDKEYQEAKEKYKASREEYDRWVEKWAELQMPNNTMNLSEFKSWLKDHDFEIVGSIDDLDMRWATSWANRYEKLSSDFPQVDQYLKDVFGRGAISYRPNEMYMMAANGGIIFGGEWRGNFKEAIKIYPEFMVSGANVRGTGTIDSVFDHEFGHNLKFAIERNGDNWYERRNQIENDIKKSLYGKQGMSEYATTNVDEMWAEGFAAWYGGEKTEFAISFGKLLKRWL